MGDPAEPLAWERKGEALLGKSSLGAHRVPDAGEEGGRGHCNGGRGTRDVQRPGH